ncbi:MAG TPA: ATP-binding protein [Thermomicrobiales bacterium]|nr:ATP-binding protein [Thermomicrobiales bacterium]
MTEQTLAVAPSRSMTPGDFGIGQLFWEIRDAAVVCDVRTGRIVLWNPSAEDLFNISAHDAVGASIEIVAPDLLNIFLHPGSSRHHTIGLEPILHADRPMEAVMVRRTGEAMTVELMWSPIKSSCVPGRFALAIIRDATARKQAEADRLQVAREQAARAAAEAEAERQGEAAALVDTLLGAAPEGLALFDATLRFTRVNHAFAEVTGVREESHLGHTLGEVAPELAATHEPLLIQVLASGEPIRDLELSSASRSGSKDQRDWLVSYYPVHGRSGERFGVGAVVVDITARKDLEREQQAFFDTASHDLRNPLAALHLQAQFLRRHANREGSAGSAWIIDAASHLEELTTRMLGMVGELTDMAHLRVGEALELARARTDLVALVRRSVEEHQESTSRHDFKFHASRSSLVGEVDAVRLERVLANMLGNAIKYSPEGGPVTVGVDERSAGAESWAIITVRDQGIGIPAEDVPHVFERHHRGANAVGKFVGSGLGLAGAKQIVELHGGTITVISHEYAGTCFEIQLPLKCPTRFTPPAQV